MFKVIGVVVGIMFTLFILAISIKSCAAVGLRLNQDINSWQERAHVAADAQDMAIYLTLLREGMEKYDMTSGQAALIFKTPENDMGLIYRALKRMETRAYILAKLPVTSDAYQQGMDDLRGTLREFETHSNAFYWRHHMSLILRYIILPWTVVIWLGPLSAGLIGAVVDSLIERRR